MIDESRILRKIQTITESLSKLEELARMERDNFLNDFGASTRLSTICRPASRQ